MASIEQLKASDGTGNANIATVQSTRAPAATTIIVDTVLGIPVTKFAGTMGTPHTFTDPVTSETITVISEATAVDFVGHVDGSNLEIDTIAPGYTDAGSEIGDIVIIRPTTQYADNLAAVLAVSLNDSGTLKTSAVQAALNIPTTPTADWATLATAPTTITDLGNRSYTIVIPGVDYTDRLSAGMRIRSTRTTAAPTQCTSLNGTNQYYNKTSPAGTTFTDDFSCMAWIKPSAYQIAPIIERADGTEANGWALKLDSSGRPYIIGINGGSGNYKQYIAYQSVPLNRWTHVGATLDMSGGTSTMYLDGISVPATTVTAGTNPTALVNTGNLAVGTNGSQANQFFAGKIAQAAYASAIISAANFRVIKNQGLTSALCTTHNIVSAYSLSNSITDINTGNANNLTAQNSAVATATDSPFGGQAGGTISSTLDYAIITKTAFSTDTTLTVQVPEGCTLPTSGAITSLAYSTQKAPYLFPAQRGKWRVETVIGSDTTQSSPTSGTVYYLNSAINIPIGDWSAGYEGACIVQNVTNAPNGQIDFSTSNSTFADVRMLLSFQVGAGAAGYIISPVSRQASYYLAAATSYYLTVRCNTASTTSVGYRGSSDGNMVLYADLALL